MGTPSCPGAPGCDGPSGLCLPDAYGLVGAALGTAARRSVRERTARQSPAMRIDAREKRTSPARIATQVAELRLSRRYAAAAHRSRP